jgi:hypothetical protein
LDRERTISPCDCRHVVRLFIQSGRSSADAAREHVTVCRDCGEFRVSATRGGVTIVTTFTLPTWDLVAAASRYVRHLDMEG